MNVIGTVGKTITDYINPDYEKAKKANWKEDIETLSELKAPLMLIDEFIVDSYDWDLIEDIINEINNNNALAGLITAYPFRTTKELLSLKESEYSSILDKFDFYMIPTNKLGYMMDSQTFMEKEREELSNLLKELDKKVIINKLLAAGIQMPSEVIEFLNSLDYADSVAIGIGSVSEAEETFNNLF